MTLRLVAGGAAGVSFGAGLPNMLAELQLQLPSLQASLDASLSLGLELQANIGIDPRVFLALTYDYFLDAQQALALSIPAIAANLNAGIGVQAGVTADLGLKLGALKLKIDALKLQLDAMLGVLVYLYQGPISQMGAEVDARIGADVGGATNVVAPIIVTTSTPAAAAVLSALGLPVL